MQFEDLNIAPALARAVADKGYSKATPIQADAIGPILAGRDLVGCAQTGTGKTAAFALPTLHRLLESVQQSKAEATEPSSPAPSERKSGEGEHSRKDRHRTSRNPAARRKTRVLVLAPTRELASQIAASFAAYGKHTPLRGAVIYGGVSQVHQVRNLQHGVDILVATPGRLLDLMQQGHVSLSHVEILIFDEADQMLDMGFLPDLRRIVARVPRERQTLMFSATMPEPIRQLANEWLDNPVSVATTPVATPAEKIEQSVYFVQKKEKTRLLAQLIGRTASTRTLVFTRTKHGADKVVSQLHKARIRAAAIHGNKSQGARERVLAEFKSDRPPVLVATDIAARGLDISGISHVINFDLPQAPETYVHRIGRTARAGAEGTAVSFCSVDEIGLLKAIERLTRRRIEAGTDHADYNLTVPTVESLAAASAPSRPARAGRSQQQGDSSRRRRPRGAGSKQWTGGRRRREATGASTAVDGETARPKRTLESQAVDGTAPPTKRRRRRVTKP